MLSDSKLLLSGAISGVDNSITPQTVTGTGNILSTNVVDLSGRRDIGEGNDVFVRAVVATAFAGATSVEVQAVVADDAGLTTNLAVIGSTGPVLLAKLTAGQHLFASINPQYGSVGQRYLGVRYVVTGTASAGAFITDIGIDVTDSRKFYPSGFTVK